MWCKFIFGKIIFKLIICICMFCGLYMYVCIVVGDGVILFFIFGENFCRCEFIYYIIFKYFNDFK